MVKIIFAIMLLQGCSLPLKDTVHSKELISSRGEKIYVNSINWGVTDDYQRSCVSTDKDKLTERVDTNNAVKGLNPFLYCFQHDTLTLYFRDEARYQIAEKFATIHVLYKVSTRQQYDSLFQVATKSDQVFTVPDR